MLALQSLEKCTRLLRDRARLICSDFDGYDSSDSEEIFTEYWDDYDGSSDDVYDLPDDEHAALRRRKRLMDMEIMKHVNDYIAALMDDIQLSVQNTLPENRSDWYLEVLRERFGPFELRCTWIHYHAIKFGRGDSPQPNMIPLIIN